MKNNFLRDNKYEAFLFLIIFSHFLFYFVIHPRFVLSDDFTYAKNAFDFFNGNFKINPHHFYNRFAVFIPTGIFYKSFGINDFTTTLWPFLINILTILTVFYFVKNNFNKEIALFSAFLIGFNFTQINWGLELSPDVIMSYFAILSVFLLYSIRINKRNEIIYGFLFVLFLFIAFLSKENVIVLLPFLLVIFIYDVYKKEHLMFWFTAFLIGAIFLMGYFAIYKVFTGSFFYRFSGIESGHNINDSSYVGKPLLLIKRLLYLPALMFIDNIYYFVLIFLSIPSIITLFKEKFNLNNPKNFWSLYAFVLFLFFWFGSTSLKYYNPFNHRQDRTWIMMIVPLSILSAVWLFNFIKETDFKKIFRASVYSIFFLFLGFILSIFSGDKKKALIWLIFIFVFAVFLLLNNKNNNFRIIFLKYFVFFPFILATLGFSYSNKKFYNYLELKNVFKAYLSSNNNEKILVITYPRLADDYLYFYKFKKPENIIFLNWEELDSHKDENYESIYLLIEEHQIALLKRRYGRYLPKFFDKTLDTWHKIYDKKNVLLFKLNSINELKENY